MEESLGPMLTRVRLRQGWSQLRVAELLCAASGVTTVTRHEMSRWEREERVPSRFWLGWLALVLQVPVEELAGAAARTRRRRQRLSRLIDLGRLHPLQERTRGDAPGSAAR
jgi:transcriptional regulator with XRE-family HTH domain